MGADGVRIYHDAFSAMPSPCLLLDAALVITDVNPAYEAAVRRPREQLVGRFVFDAFPGNPDDPHDSAALDTSLRRVLATGQADRVPLLKYDMESGPGSGTFDERWWTVVNVPIPDPTGQERVAAVLNVVEDVTELVRVQERSSRDRAVAADLRLHTEALQRDLGARSRELASIAAAEALATRRLTGLAAAALRLASAETVDDLVDVVIGDGLVALGADGGAVAVRDDDAGTVRLTLTDSLGADAQREFALLPLDGPLPASVAARTGRPVLLGDRAAGLAFSPHMREVYDTVGKVAWASLPLQVGSRLLGSLTASWSGPQTFTQGDVDLMAAFAAQCAQVLDRLLVRQAEREAATATRRLSEALQRSLLTDPPQPDHLQIVVRYLPAAQEAQVGGDWYDAFLTRDGTTSLVIGDVAGHDQDAAASMAQVRNLLRGVAHVLGEPPAAVLSGLDRALVDLTVGALATAVLAQVEQDERDADLGLRVLRWSNAGHPPPLLLRADGTAELLTRPVDLLLGLDPATPRADHTQVLEPGATVLLYTDGLVERRSAPLDQGLEWLRSTVDRLAGLELNALCDELLAELDDEIEDDIALLALRAHPVDRPRPPEAGPELLPEDLAERREPGAAPPSAGR
ncbi:MAG TPA: SpoIIE family protein phosphatase [Mycobacteriales bacterium]|nr:SpoIIE family protein phosphatase [Mycobacteriales bacterium]